MPTATTVEPERAVLKANGSSLPLSGEGGNGTMVQAATDQCEEREAQKRYWLEHTPAQPTVETMMLDSKASEIDAQERPEVLSLLGSVKGKRVLELGAGIGRFTGELCRLEAGSVLAIDFMEASILENQRLHGQLYPQLSFMVEDATQLQLPAQSFDVIFTNWLLMYLSDDEVASLAQRMLQWLAPGGVLFFRESCFKQSGDKPRKDNPTHYRNPREYFSLFDSATCGPAPAPDTAGIAAAPGPTYQFELLFSKCVDTYVRVKKNQNQICWKWRKIELQDSCSHALRHFLDGAQYSRKSLEQYESVFGHGFISCGGEAAARKLLPLLGLQAGSQVLDVGCGTGGAAALMSSEYTANVHGLDLSVNCLLTCLERANVQQGCGIVYEVADITRRELPADQYDAVHCRDCMLHVEDKSHLLNKFHTWLRPGGRLLVTDYLLPASPASPPPEAAASMQAYVEQRKYQLWTLERYEAAVQAAGFVDVVVQDRTEELVGYLETELARLQQQQQQLVTQHGADAYDALLANWTGKLSRAKSGAQGWVVVTASKST